LESGTKRDLEAAIRTGAFRQDLFFRLNVVQIKLPPLRDRKSDIPILVTAFLDIFGPAGRGAHHLRRRHAPADRLRLAWKRARAGERHRARRRAGLRADRLRWRSALQPAVPTTERTPEKDEILPLEELERRAILRTLRETGGDKLSTARMLGIGKTTLYRKLKQYHMEHAET